MRSSCWCVHWSGAPLIHTSYCCIFGIDIIRLSPCVQYTISRSSVFIYDNGDNGVVIRVYTVYIYTVLARASVIHRAHSACTVHFTSHTATLIMISESMPCVARKAPNRQLLLLSWKTGGAPRLRRVCTPTRFTKVELRTGPVAGSRAQRRGGHSRDCSGHFSASSSTQHTSVSALASRAPPYPVPPPYEPILR